MEANNDSSGKLAPNGCVEGVECVTSLVTKVTQRVYCFQASV